MNSNALDQLKQKINEYKMPAHAKELIASGEVTILCGVTAAGKNTIINHLVRSGGYEHVVSHTTRPPRLNHGKLEENGDDYWFLDNQAMLDLVADDGFIEVKAVHNKTYGTSVAEVDKVVQAGSHPLMEIDVQGALELTEAVPGLRPLFVLPPSFDVWMERIEMRGGLSAEDKKHRFISAVNELKSALGHAAFVLIVNENVQETAEAIINGVNASPEKQSELKDLARSILAEIPLRS